MHARAAEAPPQLIDAHLHAEAIGDRDLESMCIFGVRAALALPSPPVQEATAKTLLDSFHHLVDAQLGRLERAGLRAYAAVGVHPRAIPRRGMRDVLQALPSFFRGGKVVALGEIGLQTGSEQEEEVFLEQLELARRLKLAVIVHTPAQDKERLTRRVLTLVRESGIAPGKVLVDHASAATVRIILACGHFAGLTIHPDALSAEEAVRLVRGLGSERLVLDSDSGEGAGDLLGLARVASRLKRGRLSEQLVRKVAFDNAKSFFHLDLDP